MSEETKAVYEIDVTKKYVLVFEERLSHEERHRLNGLIDDWLKNENPFLVVSGGVKLFKAETAEQGGALT